MKTRKRLKKATNSSRKGKVKPSCTQVNRSTRRSARLKNETGKCAQLLVQRGDQALSSTPQALPAQLSEDNTEKPPVLQLSPGYTCDLSMKIKLQLFPINEDTRLGMEKEGHHPFLELTLRARKKISSVLRHIHSKWRSLSTSQREPMLFPYNVRPENVYSSRYWILNDSDITAGEVYAAIGSPAIFRLRYGWFTNSEFKSYGPQAPFPPGYTDGFFQVEDAEKPCFENTEMVHSEAQQLEVTSEESKPENISRRMEDHAFEKVALGELAKPMDVEFGSNSGNRQSLLKWDDDLADISIGGLLSEASLMGKLNNGDPKPGGTNSGSVSDSFDAFVASKLSSSQGPGPTPHGTHTSILDAEETCHAFPLRKSSDSNDLAITESGISGVSKQDNSQLESSPNHASQEPKRDLFLSSQPYNDESSLGFRGIKWSDSLGPFDLLLPSSQK